MTDIFFPPSWQLAVARITFVIHLGGLDLSGKNLEFVSPNVAVRIIDIVLCCLK